MSNRLNPSKIYPLAVIFDMDGLMFDTERIAQTAWRYAAAECGYDFSEKIFRGVIGRTLPDVEQFTYRTFGPEFPFAVVYDLKRAYVVEYLMEHGLPLKPGLPELLELIEKKSLPKAVASSSNCEVITHNLRLAGLEDGCFEVLVGGEEVQKGKPAPDIFLLAGRRLGVPAEFCLVLEDSNAGIKAAQTAGMIPVMIPDMLQPSEESKRLAYQILPSLHEVGWLLQS